MHKESSGPMLSRVQQFQVLLDFAGYSVSFSVLYNKEHIRVSTSDNYYLY